MHPEKGAAIRETPLHGVHVGLGARMAEFGGWDMPIHYPRGILAEHRAVRTATGMFDVSHMGRLVVSGDGAEATLQRAFTNDVASLRENQAQYSLMLADDGGTLDDVLVYRLPGRFLIVVNASNRLDDVAWLRSRAARGFELRDDTEETGMLAVQGPQALATVQRLTDVPLREIRYYHSAEGVVGGAPCTISRTGYTGEDGVELICPSLQAVALWHDLEQAGADLGLQPAGLGARDTLRTEAGMALYGHELSRDRTPFEAGLHRYVAMDKGDFHGRQALALHGVAPPETLVGIIVEGRVPARAETPLHAGDARVGAVTSGTFSPTLERSIAMAYVDRAHAAAGTRLEAEIRGNRHPARVVPLPFYHRRRTARARG